MGYCSHGRHRCAQLQCQLTPILPCPQPHRGDERLRYLQCDAKEGPRSPLVNIVGITAFIRCAHGVEAAGNSGRSSGTNALQARQTAQDFWRAVRPLVA